VVIIRLAAGQSSAQISVPNYTQGVTLHWSFFFFFFFFFYFFFSFRIASRGDHFSFLGNIMTKSKGNNDQFSHVPYMSLIFFWDTNCDALNAHQNAQSCSKLLLLGMKDASVVQLGPLIYPTTQSMYRDRSPWQAG
jgi:hypothetical protein